MSNKNQRRTSGKIKYQWEAKSNQQHIEKQGRSPKKTIHAPGIKQKDHDNS